MTDKRDFKDDLNLMQTVYGVALVLSLRNIVESVYSIIITFSIFNSAVIIKLFSSIILTFIVMRFFWALGNIRRFMFRNIDKLQQIRRYLITLHFFILLVHAFLIYFISKYILDMNPQSSIKSSSIIIFHSYALLLIFNVIWLTILTYQHTDKFPEKIWIRNNLATAIITLLLFWTSLLLMKDYFVSFIIVSIALVINSLIDLFRTSSSYIGEIAKN